TIYGEVTLKIPAGTSHGTVLKMGGQGIANVQNKKKGDQLVHCMVDIPKNLSGEEKKLFEKLASLESKKQASAWE
ncbi:MAG: DnaJ C-terminal domain-containing protein, partial [Acholeplasmataceae bacterium]